MPKLPIILVSYSPWKTGHLKVLRGQFLRPSFNQIASIVQVLTVSCLLLTVSLIGISPSSVIKALLDSGTSLNLLHDGLIQALGLATEFCV